ncbi:MAG TPA: hypothetical protein K8V93_03480 [Corynebacterium pollutisoli]|nr:hypothetical protein [Corynebacterium pollutisoli]
MIRRRLAVALVAATSTTLALVTPVQAQDDTGSSLDAVSTVSSLSSTDSTAPEVDEPVEDPVEMPEWAKSLELSDDAALAFEIVKAVMAVGLAVTQGAVIVLPFIPGGVDQLRNFLAQFGIQG